MSRSAIYTANTTPTALAVGNIIPVGTMVRRFGKCINQDGNIITLSGPGYYLVNASVTVAPTAAGTVSVTGQKDGVAVIGATASATTAAAAASANLSLDFIVRNVGCGSSILSFALGGAESTVSNLAVTVTKL